jgi:fermentation-respiration switch protein FrsA (DUF1100 family)
MNSTLKAFALLLCFLALPAKAFNHEEVVNPLPLGRFAVACSNVEIDTGRLAQLGGNAADYYEGHTVNGQTRYITDILAHPESAFRFQERLPAEPWLYPTLFLQRPEFVALVCHPTPRTNGDANYRLPDDGGLVPHMQRAGQPPKLISASEYATTSGLPDPHSSAPAQLPLIVYSHGLGGSPVGKGYIDVAVQLAAQGYLVAAVFHADNRYSPVKIENLGDFAFAVAFFPVIVQMQALRPFALKAMTDHLIADGDFGPAIDRSRIGAFGASLGGEAVAHLVGAGLTVSIARDCSDTEQDPRIRAVVGYVPYSGQSFLPAFCDEQSGADAVDRPFLAISGTLDITAPIAMTRRAVSRMRSSRYLVELVGGQHELRPEDAADVLTWMVTYFNAYLDVKADPTAMARFIRMRQVVGGREDNLILDVHVPFAPHGSEVPVVEFHNTLLDHYFISAVPSEIDAVSSGAAGPGWERTGQSFKAWLQIPSDTFVPVNPVCRFYGLPAGGPNSHFYTAIPAECEMVKSWGGWHYEGVGFYARPSAYTATCPPGWLAVMRAYNNGYVRNDSNHRFSTSDSTLRAMGQNGWSVEGNVMCSLP